MVLGSPSRGSYDATARKLSAFVVRESALFVFLSAFFVSHRVSPRDLDVFGCVALHEDCVESQALNDETRSNQSMLVHRLPSYRVNPSKRPPMPVPVTKSLGTQATR